MEITYDAGAKVILQAPCTYEVESPHQRLSCRWQGDGKSRKAGRENCKSRFFTIHYPLSHYPLLPIPNP